MDIQDLEHPRQEIEKAVASGDLHWLLRVNGLLHGHYCPGSATGVKAAARAVIELGVRSTGMEEVIAIVETNSCFSDGIQMITGCSLGNNALIYRDYGKMALTLARKTGEGIRIAIKPDGLALEKREPEAVALFRKVVTERRGTPAEDRALKKIWIEVAFKLLDVPDEELFINSIKAEIPAYARIFGNAQCSQCGENIVEPRARLKNNQPVCISCAGSEYYQLAGDGTSIIHK